MCVSACVCLCACRQASLCMHMQVSTATSFAWSLEVNPGGYHPFPSVSWRLGPTSASCVAVAAPQRQVVQREQEEEVPEQWEADGYGGGVGGGGEVEEGAEEASAP